MGKKFPEDPALTLRAKTDVAAAEELFGRYQYAIEGWVLGLKAGMGGRESEEDCQAAARLAFFQAVANFDPAVGKFSTFLRVMVRRNVIDVFRSDTRSRGGLDPAGETRRSLPAAVRAEQEDSPETPLEALLGKEDSSDLTEALAALSEAQREVLNLRFVDGQTLREMGRTLGCSPTHAASQVAAAVAELRKKFL